MNNTLTTYIEELQRLIDEIDQSFIEELVAALMVAWQEQRMVLLMGNGGSGGSASHTVADLQKNVQIRSGRALKALSLSDCTPLVSAWANDSEWNNIFAPQVECWARKDDLVIALSGSGNSMNVVNAIDVANRLGAVTYALTGFDGGKLAPLAQRSLIVQSNNMQRVEDIHMIILHMVFLRLLEELS